MWALSTLAQQVIRGSHSFAVRGTAYGTAQGTLTNLPITDGSVTCDVTSQVRRTATISVADPGLWPLNPTDLLSPMGAELLIEYGIALPGAGMEWIPLIRGVLTEADRQRPYQQGQGPVTVSLSDRSLHIAEDRYPSPTQVGGTSATVPQVIGSIIQRTLPTAVINDLTGSAQIASSLDINQDPWADGVEQLATAIGAECFCDQQGNFVIRPVPQITNPYVWVIDTGPGGVLVNNQEQQQRATVYNQVVASGQRSDGTAPVSVTVTDNDPTSPTYYGGSFGHKPLFYSSALLTTAAQCTTAANALLAQVKGWQEQVTLQTVTNPALDGGDVILLRDSGTVTAHIVDSVQTPLAPGNPQQIIGRTLTLPAGTS